MIKTSAFLFFVGYSIFVFSQNTDINLLRSINIDRNKNLDPTFVFITNSASPVSLVAPAVVFSTGLIRHDSAVIHKGFLISETLLLSALFTVGLKYSINRPRPFVTYPDIEKMTSGGSPSFPSGHTSDAFATATSLSIAFPKWYVIAPAFMWATAVGYSRMHLGVHYPSDVIAGAIVGSGSAFICGLINKKIQKK